jgi:hypothetical protein
MPGRVMKLGRLEGGRAAFISAVLEMAVGVRYQVSVDESVRDRSSFKVRLGEIDKTGPRPGRRRARDGRAGRMKPRWKKQVLR